MAALANVQSPDGSWTVHHCIRSPMFSTALVQTLTAECDAELLVKAASLATQASPK